MPWLRQVCSVSETARAELRALVREAWGVQLVDMYRPRKSAYIALQCPDYDHTTCRGRAYSSRSSTRQGTLSARGARARWW